MTNMFAVTSKGIYRVITGWVALESGHPGYHMSFREKVLCTLGFHRDTVTDNWGDRYCGRCGRPNPVDVEAAKMRPDYGSERS